MSLDDRDWWREDRRRKDQQANIDAMWAELDGKSHGHGTSHSPRRQNSSGCGPLFATIICVVLLVLVVAPLYQQGHESTDPGAFVRSFISELTQDFVHGKEDMSEGQRETSSPTVEFHRNVPYREIDITQSAVECDAGVSEESVQKVQSQVDTMLSTDYLKRQFYGNGWKVYVTNQALPMQHGIQPAGTTDTATRRISLVEEHIDRAIYHEFGHYFMAMYVFNVPGAQAELQQLYAEEGAQFQSHTGIAEDTVYGQTNVDEFIASIFDNIVHNVTGICPKTEAYVQNMYGALMQMDYADVFSVDYDYHHNFEELLEKYGASYEFYIDGQMIDSATYDVHDLTAMGYESSVTDYGGHGTVTVTTR